MSSTAKYSISLLVFSLLGLPLVCNWTIDSGETAQRAAAQCEAGRGESTKFRVQPLSDRKNYPVEKIPASLLSGLRIDCFDEDTGEVTAEISRALDLTKEERLRVRKLVLEYIARFAIIEAENGQVFNRSDGNTVIRLKSCTVVISGLNEEFERKFHEILGLSRGDVIASLLKKQLRNGGGQSMDISLIRIPEINRVVLVKEKFSENGQLESRIEEPLVSAFDLFQSARWRHFAETWISEITH